MTADTQAQGDLVALPMPALYGSGDVKHLFTADQMREYGRACIAAALQGRGTQEGEPSDAVQPIYYMRDNHSFKRLEGSIDEMVTAIGVEFDRGYTFGMLCSKRPGFMDVHARGLAKRREFLDEARAALAQESRVSVEIREAM